MHISDNILSFSIKVFLTKISFDFSGVGIEKFIGESIKKWGAKNIISLEAKSLRDLKP